MATIANALRQRVLELYELPDWELRLPIRPLYIAPEFWNWTDSADAHFETRNGSGGRSPFEHIEQMCCDLRCSIRPHSGGVRRMMPTREGILSVHPPHARLYGWCCEPHVLVLVTGALETETKSDRSLNDRKRDRVSDFVRLHKLEETILRGDVSAIFPPTVKPTS